MEACERRFQELESSLKSFIESYTERMIKTDMKLETICNRIDRLEPLGPENNGEFTEMEIAAISIDENVVTQKQKVN